MPLGNNSILTATDMGKCPGLQSWNPKLKIIN